MSLALYEAQFSQRLVNFNIIFLSVLFELIFSGVINYQSSIEQFRVGSLIFGSKIQKITGNSGLNEHAIWHLPHALILSQN